MQRRKFLSATAAGTAAVALAASGCSESQANEGSECEGAGGAGGGGGPGGPCTHLTPIPSADPEIIRPGEGDAIEGSDMIYKIRAREMGNYWSMMEGILAPGEMVAPHTHSTYDQAVFVIEGEIQMFFGEYGSEIHSVGAGSYVVKPKGLAHCFWNASETDTVVYIELSANTTFEDASVAAEGVEDFAELDAIAKAHGVFFHYHEIPVIMRDHGLTKVKGSSVELPFLDEEGNLPSGPPERP